MGPVLFMGGGGGGECNTLLLPALAPEIVYHSIPVSGGRGTCDPNCKLHWTKIFDKQKKKKKKCSSPVSYARIT